MTGALVVLLQLTNGRVVEWAGAQIAINLGEMTRCDGSVLHNVVLLVCLFHYLLRCHAFQI